MQSTRDTIGTQGRGDTLASETISPEPQPSAGALARSYLRTVFEGWWSLATALLRTVGARAADTSLVQVAFLAGCLGIIATTLLFPWIVYDVNLLAPEVAGRGSVYRIFFFLPGPLGLLLYFIGGRFRLPAFYGVVGLVGALYLAGMLWPNPVHTLMSDPAEYRFHFSIYVYGAALLLTAATAWQALQNHLVSLSEMRSYLLEPRAPQEPLNSPELSERHNAR
ncbi:MAG: hypothetical protein NXI24_00270 [bacterium]|nr:hypothetical protein [bacterium]